VIIGESQKTVDTAAQLQQAGFYIMPVRPPTVPVQSSRLRICLNTQFQQDELDQFVVLL
jgi:8-amino-7-oxononanoate synthase